jgi:hypothetical protein
LNIENHQWPGWSGGTEQRPTGRLLKPFLSAR